MKQVIVMRTDLNMRKGKMIAQGAHATMQFLFDSSIVRSNPDLDAAQIWVQNGMKKICVRADSEEELLAIHAKALNAGLRAHVVTDAGHTEFHGIPTMTCLAIGPNADDAVDAITKELKLL